MSRPCYVIPCKIIIFPKSCVEPQAVLKAFLIRFDNFQSETLWYSGTKLSDSVSSLHDNFISQFSASQFCFSELHVLLFYIANFTFLHLRFYFSPLQIFCLVNVTFLFYQFYFHCKVFFNSQPLFLHCQHFRTLLISLFWTVYFMVLQCQILFFCIANFTFLHCLFHFYALPISFFCTVNFNFLHCLFHFYALPISLFGTVNFTFVHCQFHFSMLPISWFFSAKFYFSAPSVSLFCSAKFTFYTDNFTFLCNLGGLNL